MKVLMFIISCLCLMLVGCKGSQQISATSESNTIVKDSVFVEHITIVDTIYLPKQTIEATVPMKYLEQMGEFRMSKDNLTTTVIYRNDSLNIKTDLDSLLTLRFTELNNKFERLEKSKDQKEVKVIEENKKSWMPEMIILLCMLIVILIIIIKIKK